VKCFFLFFLSDNGNPQINYLLPPLAAAIEDTFVRLAGDGDISVFVILVVAGSRVSWCRLASSRALWCREVWGSIARSFVFRLVAGRRSGSNSQESADDKLRNKIETFQ
jgi:hypothetical protein